MQNSKNVLGAFSIAIFLVFAAFAQNQVDMTFNAAPSLAVNNVNNTKGQAVQADGKVIVWGGSLTEASTIKGLVARLNADGSLDTSFSFCGCSFASVTNVTVLADGKMLVSGSNSFNRGKVIRIDPSGGLDVTYSSPFTGAIDSPGRAARIRTIQPDGMAIIEATGGDGSSTLGRYQTNGLVDNSFTPISLGSSVIVYVPEVIIAPDGKFYIGTSSFIISHQFASLKRFNADGTPDAGWNPPSIPQDTGAINGLAIEPDGSLLISGLTTINGVAVNRLARLLPAGNVDLSFSVSGFVSIGQIKLLQSGKILIAASDGVGNLNRLYRLNSNGSIDNSLAKPAAAETEAGMGAGTEKLSAAQGGVKSVRDVRSGDEQEFAFTGSIPVLNRFVLDASENAVFFGQSDSAEQQFYRVGTNGTLDPGFDSNVAESGTVSFMLRQPDGKVIIQGSFISVNGLSQSRFARLNTDGTLDGTFNPGTGFVGEIYTMLMQPDGKILATGNFDSYNGMPVSKLVRLNSDGSLDGTFNHHVLIGVNTIALQPDGKILVAGGGLVRINSDGSADNTFSVTFGSPSLNSLVVQADGKVVAGGSFGGVNGFNRNNLARLNSDGSLDLTYNPTNTAGGFTSLWLQPDGKVLTVSSDGGQMRRLNTDGSSDSGFTNVTFTTNTSTKRIYSVVFKANGEILVGGEFSSVSGAATANFAWLNSSGHPQQLIFPDGVNGPVHGLALQPDGKVMMGGEFSRIDNTPRAGVARVSLARFHGAPQFDFDGDGRADISIFRPSDGNWYLARSSAGFTVTHWGQNGDRVAAADYDGDGKTDLAVYRNGQWWYLKSTTGTFSIVGWGTANDTLVPSDFDGDGKADFVFFQPTTGLWVRMSSSTGIISNIQFGLPGDIPLVADFDGDGKADPTIFRPEDGVIWYASSADGLFYAHPWGKPGDIPVLGDYDGDGRTDPAVFRPATRVWYIMNSNDGSITTREWGFSDDRPTPADYDGDGRTDIAIYRPSNGMWFISRSTGGPTSMQFGLSSDTAVPNAYIP
ncbi:MAG TPA: FG-GAP-like repeat-containing protein [Pyrinomonadaceae bacterium]|jgi:uncharacterized delta-60 repeat protein|nr:FG-GAP-like repeat-containing protein [Pyrinomonadaceae bacterium]